ncbi:MAG TPA: EAL domain-containing protein [Steroidobacteraceae bacterium]|nr:EAL domain-containing protein [Steroidobacteraceae bacterium]
MSERARILCVDDEVEVLRGLALHLGRRYEVLTATSGADALKLLERDPRVEVIISDMRMPGLSGSEFLTRSRAFAPEAQRILLTGQTDLASAISAINEGQIFRFLSKPCPAAELISTIEAALERYRARALEHTTVRRKLEHRQLQIDPLTGLASRLQLMAVLEAAAYEVTEAVSAVVAYYFAIDGSDEPVANRDQPWGDELAKIIAGRLKQQCPDATVVACWGIAQFVVIVSSAGASDLDLCARGEKLWLALTAPTPEKHVAVGVSVGIARLVDRQQWQRLIQQAATAADEARHEQSSRVCLYRPDAPPRAEKQRELVHALREALIHDGLHLHYQPIVDIGEGRVRGLECLARWEHGTLGNIVPAKFIPLAEHSGDIVRLGQWVLWRACHEARQIVCGRRLEVAVNVSAKQLMDSSFLPHLEKCLSHSGLAPELLELELTESALAVDMEHLREVLEQTRRLKVRIAVDDFGTGYSSLSYLSRLPIDLIKVDQTFVRDFHRGGKTIIKAALSIARDFGLEVIIEGVETAEMLQQVRDLGASLIQGYWFARPMPAAQVPDWLRVFEFGSLSARAVSS